MKQNVIVLLLVSIFEASSAPTLKKTISDEGIQKVNTEKKKTAFSRIYCLLNWLRTVRIHMEYCTKRSRAFPNIKRWNIM